MKFKKGDIIVAKQDEYFITEGRKYKVLAFDVAHNSVLIVDDHNAEDLHPAKYFKLCTNGAEELLDRIKDKFKDEFKDALFRGVVMFLLKKRFKISTRAAAVLFGFSQNTISYWIRRIKANSADRKVKRIMKQLEQDEIPN